MSAATSAAAPRGWRATVAPLRHRNFALVWTAGMVSNVGTWMETVAVGDHIARSTGKAGLTALVAAAGFLPMGLLGPVGGALADRLDRRRMLLAMTAAQMACAAVLTAFAATDHLSAGWVALVVFAAGCVAGVGFPAYSAMLPDLVPSDELLAGMSLSQAQWNLGRVIGPALAGIAIGLGSYTAALAINTASFAAMLLALALLRLPPHVAPTDAEPMWSRIATGARSAWAEPGVRSAIILISIVAVTASPFIALIPAMATVRFDGSPALTARFVTAQGVGAVLGALILPALGARFGRYRMLRISLVALPCALVLYGASPTALAATGALVLVGTTYMFAFSGIGTTVQLRAPQATRARVLSIYFLALGTLYPIAAYVQGPIADRLGIGVVTIAAGAALLGAVVVLAVAFPGRLAAMDDPSPDVAPPEPPPGPPPAQPGSVSPPTGASTSPV